MIVYGDGQPHLVALIVPDAEFAKAYARQRELQPDLDELVEQKDFERAIGEAVARANESLSVIERVRHFRLLAKPFTVENGTMTPTLKLKRPLIYRLHKELFEGMYQHQDSVRVAARADDGELQRSMSARGHETQGGIWSARRTARCAL